MNVWDYIAEEVSRQGHDVFALDGLERIGWMLDGWSYALVQANDGNVPNFEHVVELGKLVERHKNERGLRKVGGGLRKVG